MSWRAKDLVNGRLHIYEDCQQAPPSTRTWGSPSPAPVVSPPSHCWWRRRSPSRSWRCDWRELPFDLNQHPGGLHFSLMPRTSWGCRRRITGNIVGNTYKIIIITIIIVKHEYKYIMTGCDNRCMCVFLPAGQIQHHHHFLENKNYFFSLSFQVNWLR